MLNQISKHAEVIKAPGRIPLDTASLFLGGSIEMGKAEDWQTVLSDALADLPVIILNPRRDDWDATWEQTIANPQFREQVEWELAAQEYADLRVYYFSPGTQSPITLLELGTFKDQECIVCCPEGFWRRGNVEILCRRYGIPFCENIDTLAALVRRWFEGEP